MRCKFSRGFASGLANRFGAAIGIKFGIIIFCSSGFGTAGLAIGKRAGGMPVCLLRLFINVKLVIICCFNRLIIRCCSSSNWSFRDNQSQISFTFCLVIIVCLLFSRIRINKIFQFGQWIPERNPSLRDSWRRFLPFLMFLVFLTHLVRRLELELGLVVVSVAIVLMF